MGRGKRALYTLCFAALGVLDFVRNTQNGDIWGVAVNLTGLVVMALVVSARRPRGLAGPGSAAWTLACVGLSAYALASIRHTGMDIFCGVYVWTFVTAVANVWWIAIVLADMVKQAGIKKVLGCRPGWLGGIWLLMTVLMMCSRSQRIWPLWFLAMFGIFYLTPYSQEDGRALADGLVDGTILGFFGLQIFAYGFRPYDVVRYAGAYANSNMAALHYLVVYMAVLIKLHMLHKRGASKWLKLFYMAGACGLPGFLFMTMGRTSWVVAVLFTLAYGFFAVRRSWGLAWGQVAARGAALAVGAMLLFPAVFGTVRWLPTILHHPIWFLDEYSVNKVHSFDPADSWKYVEMDEFMEAVLGRIWRTFRVGAGDAPGPFVLVAHAAGQEEAQEGVRQEGAQELDTVGEGSIDTSIGIRLSIYKAYFQELNLTGHGPREGMFRFNDQEYHAWHAQNLWLEVAYRYGIPTGALFAIVTIWLLVRHARGLKRPQAPDRAIIPLSVCIVFFGYGIMELVWNTGQYILVLFFIVQHPLFYGGNNRCDRSIKCGSK